MVSAFPGDNRKYLFSERGWWDAGLVSLLFVLRFLHGEQRELLHFCEWLIAFVQPSRRLCRTAGLVALIAFFFLFCRYVLLRSSCT